MPPKVSVCITSFNHEAYIAQCVESALMQVTDFDYEIVVEDDGSTDRTPTVLAELERKNQDRLRLRLHPHNLGGQGRRNFLATLDACRGQYVTVLDADDYWTSPHKLARGAAYLDHHPESAMCFHRCEWLDEDGTRSLCPPPPGRKQVYGLTDLLMTNFISHSFSMFRRGLFADLPSWFHDEIVGDWVLHILNAQHGNIGYLDEVVGVYRRLAGSLSQQDRGIRILEQGVRTTCLLKGHLGSRYHRILDCSASHILFEMAFAYCRQSQPELARRTIARALRSFRVHPRMVLSDYKIVLRVYLPWVHGVLQKSKNTLGGTRPTNRGRSGTVV